MIAEIVQKVKQVFDIYKADIVTAVILLLVAGSAFGLGRLSAVWPIKDPFRITFEPPVVSPSVLTEQIREGSSSHAVAGAIADKKRFVGSRNGSVYYLPTCSGTNRIKDANKVWFSSREQAEQKGYRPAANCPGL